MMLSPESYYEEYLKGKTKEEIIYKASSKDSYRNDNNNGKDFEKIDFFKRYVDNRE